jgi:2C-methyl-D-erythritol 2,4-cyclodiphosphate synthase
VSTESVLLTAVIDAQRGHHVATGDIPNAFIQTDVQAQDNDGNRIIEIRGAFVDNVGEMDPFKMDHTVKEGHQSVLFVHQEVEE